MNVDVVHRVEIEDGRDPPASPFCAQLVNWPYINAQQRAAREFARLRGRDAAFGPEPTLVGLSPLWP